MRESGDWDRVEADLRAASDDDPQLAGLREAGMNWLDDRAATTWAHLSDRQRERIESYLRTAHLDDQRRRTLAFHAGIKAAPAPTDRAWPSDTTGEGRPKAHDERQVSAERRYLSERSMALLANRSDEEAAKPELMTA